MANFNYGINCETKKKAEKLYLHISNLNIYQKGLDISDERVMLISSQSLKDEISKYSDGTAGEINVEIWPENLEYDEAEEKNKIEIFDFKGKKSKKTDTELLSTYRSYCGSEDNIETFKKWLSGQTIDGFSVTETWVPQVEYGSYGIEYTAKEPKFDKLINKEWMKKGIVTEKKKNK
jgi:hypothetical protein